MPAIQVSASQLHDLDNGSDALQAFEDSQPKSRRSSQRTPGFVDWTTLPLSDSEGPLRPRRRGARAIDSDADPGEAEDVSDDEEGDVSDEDLRKGRRSARLSQLRKSTYL